MTRVIEGRLGFAGEPRALGPGECEGGIAPFVQTIGGHIGALPIQ